MATVVARFLCPKRQYAQDVKSDSYATVVVHVLLTAASQVDANLRRAGGLRPIKRRPASGAVFQ